MDERNQISSIEESEARIMQQCLHHLHLFISRCHVQRSAPAPIATAHIFQIMLAVVVEAGVDGCRGEGGK